MSVKQELNENNLFTFEDFYQFHKMLFFSHGKLSISEEAINKFIEWNVKNRMVDSLREAVENINYTSDLIRFCPKNNTCLLDFTHSEEDYGISRKEAYVFLVCFLAERGSL
jgi:hypothetical protein